MFGGRKESANPTVWSILRFSKKICDQCYVLELCVLWRSRNSDHSHGNMNTDKYIEVLDQTLWPIIGRYFPNQSLIFHKDNVKCHLYGAANAWKKKLKKYPHFNMARPKPGPQPYRKSKIYAGNSNYWTIKDDDIKTKTSSWKRGLTSHRSIYAYCMTVFPRDINCEKGERVYYKILQDPVKK